jgi:hypothetical protein
MMKPDMATTAPTAGPAFYVASTIKAKRHRRLKSEMNSIRGAIKRILEASNPQTVRQVFYALTVEGVIAKLEIEYQRTAVRLLGEMRESGAIPFEWISDNTRWMRKPASFTGIEQCLNSAAEFYRRNLWHSSPVYVEVWVEKDALAGVVLEETKVYDVPLMAARVFLDQLLAQRGTGDRSERQARLHLSLWRPGPVRRRCGSRHRSQATPLRTQRRDPLRTTGRYPATGRRMESSVSADQAEGPSGKEVDGNLGGTRRERARRSTV